MLAFVLGELMAYMDNVALFLIVPVSMSGHFLMQKSKRKSAMHGKIAKKDREKSVEKESTIRKSEIKGVVIRVITCSIIMLMAVFTGYSVMNAEIATDEKINNIADKNVTVYGNVDKIQKTQYGWNIELKNVYINKIHTRRLLIQTDKKPEVRIGNKIKTGGDVKFFDRAANKGNFDKRQYYKSLGIYASVHMDKCEIIGHGTDFFRNELSVFRQRAEDGFDRMCEENKGGLFSLCNEKAKGVFKAVILGQKQEMDAEIKDLFQINGIAHILAISGLHISVTGMFVYSLFRRKFKFISSVTVSLVVVISFAVMTGMSISTVRAVSMFCLRLLADILGRTYDTVSAMSFAIMIILLSNPYAMFNSGFQMSFLAIAGAGLVAPIWNEFLDVKNKKIKAILFSISITAVMNPVIAENFFQIPTYSVIVNLFVVPLMNIVLASGVTAMLIGVNSAYIGRIFLLPGVFVLKAYTVFCNVTEKLPGYNIITGKPSVYRLIAYYAVLIVALIVMKRYVQRRNNRELFMHIPKEGIVIEDGRTKWMRNVRSVFYRSIASVCILIAMSALIYFPFHRGFSTTFLNVGQGDCIFMRGEKGKTIMVDGGSTDVKEVGKYRIIPYLKSQGIRKIDYAVMSHADNDHINGLKEILLRSGKGEIVIKHVILPFTNLRDENYMEIENIAGQKKIPVLYIKQNDEMKIGRLKIKCMHPAKTFVTQERNNYSTVLYVKYDAFSMILTGDVNAETEREFSYYQDKGITVLKVAHHGSKYSTSQDFLNRVRPKYCVISDGKGNSYGHPHKELMDRLKSMGTNILRTDINGQIDFKIYKNMMVEAYPDS